jgi:hypothetical protein
MILFFMLFLFLLLHFCFCPPWTEGFMLAKFIAQKAWHATCAAPSRSGGGFIPPSGSGWTLRDMRLACCRMPCVPPLERPFWLAAVSGCKFKCYHFSILPAAVLFLVLHGAHSLPGAWMRCFLCSTKQVRHANYHVDTDYLGTDI